MTAADERAPSLGEQPAHLLRAHLVLGPAADDGDLSSACHEPSVVTGYFPPVDAREPKRVLLFATVTALALTALIAIVALLAGNFDDTQVRILATTGGFGLASLISMRGTALLERGLFVRLAWSVIGLCALAFALEFALLWITWNHEPARLWKSFAVVLAFAVALGQIAGMLARRRPQDPGSITLLLTGAGACAVVLAFMVSTAAIGEIDDTGFYRLLGVIAVLDVVLVALQPVVRRLGSSPPQVVETPGGFVCVLEDGRRIRGQMRGRDLAASVAAALREFQRRGERVRNVEIDM